MSRGFVAAVIAALALPVLALAAMVGEQERQLAGATIISVPIRGYDPRDLLAGHYLNAQFDWDWDRGPEAQSAYESVKGGACVQPAKPKPRLRFLAGWKPGDRVDADCKLVIAGRGWPGTPARFIPASLDTGSGGIRFYVPEERAHELEGLVQEKPDALTADLAVRADGSVAIGTLRIDGKALGERP
jgi:hypothetical protein